MAGAHRIRNKPSLTPQLIYQFFVPNSLRDKRDRDLEEERVRKIIVWDKRRQKEYEEKLAAEREAKKREKTLVHRNHKQKARYQKNNLTSKRL